MPSKRKRGIATPVNSRDSTPRKRSKGTSSLQKPVIELDEDDADDEPVYSAKGILDEKRIRKRLLYLVDWEPDKQTGEAYEPTWEPVNYLGQGLIDDWEESKARKAHSASSPSDTAATQTSVSSPAIRSEAAKASKRVAKARPFIDSDDPTTSPNHQPTADQDTHQVAETQQASRVTAYVCVLEPSSSYSLQEYLDVAGSSQFQAASTVSESQLQSTQSQPSGSSYLPTQAASAESAVIESGSTTQDSTDRVHTETIAPASSDIEAETSGLFVPDSQSGHEQFNNPRAPNLSVPRRAGAAVVVSPSRNPTETQAEAADEPGEQTPFRLTSILHQPDAHDLNQVGSDSISESIGPVLPAPSTQSNTQQSASILPISFQRPVDSSQFSRSPSSGVQGVEQPKSAQFESTQASGADSKPHLSSPFQSTPTVTPLPSQPFQLGESAPPRPETLLSIETMDRPSASASPGSDVAARLQALRAERQEQFRDFKREVGRRESTAHSTRSNAPVSPIVANRTIAEAVANRTIAEAVAPDNPTSPVAIPAVEPHPTVTQEEMNTSERYGTLIPEPHSDTPVPQADVSSLAAPGEVQRHEDGIDLVPIVMTGHQRDSYPQTVLFHQRDITAYLDSDHPDEEATKLAELVIDKLRKITIHPDLIDADTLTPPDNHNANHGPQAHAEWDKNTSSKFRFIDKLCQAFTSSALDVALLCPTTDIADRIRVFLANISSRPLALDDARDSGSCNFLVVNLQDSGIAEAPVDLVVGMDHSLTYEQMSSKGLLRLGGRPTRAIALIVPNSVEHIELSLSKALPRDARLRQMLKAVRQYRRQAGENPDAHITVSSVAAAVASSMLSGEQEGWTVPSLSVLHDLDSQTQTDLSDNSHSGTNGKRPLDAGEDTNAKRARLAAAPSTDSQAFDSTRVSDSVANVTSSKPVSSARNIDDIEALLGRLQEAEEKRRELTDALEGLQFRFEEQREQFVEISNQRDQAMLTASRAATRLEEQQKTLSTSRAECTALKEQLGAAHAALLSHSVPERAEFEALRAQLRAETTAREKAEARVRSIEGERDYARESYQTASKQATEFLHQSRELEKQLGDAEGRASTEHAKVRQMHLDTHTSLLRKDNMRLKALLKERDAALRIRDEENARLKEAGRGRMGTRGTSLPRSPRMGSPLKMATDGRGRVSRAGSPIKTNNHGVQHPLRNG